MTPWYLSRHLVWAGLLASLAHGTLAGSLHEADGQESPRPVEPFVVTQDTVLDKDRVYGPIVIAASGITLDGNGITLTGPGRAGEPRTFQGIAIRGAGISRVTIKNIRARGWETGLHLRDADQCVVEHCDFSDNFHDPKFGWGENGRRGGLLLERVRRSTIRQNHANRVWDACTLVESDHNELFGNDFSHASNTCLKLWTASHNHVHDNNLSHGIRKDPGEVHARDSTCVLIESGSNHNRLVGNDCTHGGDGIFVRVLNGWCSSGNHFERNDCSHANNNGFECWSPENTFIGNKANHCSYGFWMGGSDRSVLIGNEASHNGQPTGSHNSPHLPDRGHAGIVFMFGPSSHSVARENVCRDNQGAGIAIIGDQGSQGSKWRAFHWIVEGNTLERNRWGIFLEFADWIDIAGNRHRDNQVADVHVSQGVSRLTIADSRAMEGANTDAPHGRILGPSSSVAGQPVTWTAESSRESAGRPWQFSWDLGGGESLRAPTVTKTFNEPGFYRVGLTQSDGVTRRLAWRDFYVLDPGDERGTESGARHWDWVDEQSPPCKVTYADDVDVRLSGKSSVRARVAPYNGGRVHLRYPREQNLDFPWTEGARLVFWLKAHNPNLPGFQDVNPIVTLFESGEVKRQYRPSGDLLSQPTYNEAREGWRRIEVPLDGGDGWEVTGSTLRHIASVTLGIDSWGGDPLELWIDGLQFLTPQRAR